MSTGGSVCGGVVAISHLLPPKSNFPIFICSPAPPGASPHSRLANLLKLSFLAPVLAPSVSCSSFSDFNKKQRHDNSPPHLPSLARSTSLTSRFSPPATSCPFQRKQSEVRMLMSISALLFACASWPPRRSGPLSMR